MRYTLKEREDLARRKERWILRVEHGEAPGLVRRELKLKVKNSNLERLQRRYRQGGRTWQALVGRRHGVATKGTPAVKAFLAKAKGQNPQLTGAELCLQVWERFEIEISLGRLNALVRETGLSNPPGRPTKTLEEEAPAATAKEVDNAGAFFPIGRAHRTGRTRRSAKRD